MALISVKNVHMSFGGPKLLDGVSFQVHEGQRVCIVGRNGEGKSTLLRLLSGDLEPDHGEISRSQGLAVARLSQKVPEVLSGTIYEVVTHGLGRLAPVLEHYRETSRELASMDTPGPADLERLARAEARLDEHGGWEALPLIDTVLSKLNLDPDLRFETLSGGLKRRALLARALVGDPDVLLLDEPTNHLDIEAIAWLEEFLPKHARTLVFITHDRMFLRRMATRIIELDRGRLADWSCDYDTFLKRRDELLAAEEKEWARFDKKLAKEEAWIRQGIKARRTRNEGRVRALKKMRRERMDRRERTGKASIQVQEAARSGRMVVQAKDISFNWDGDPVFKNFSTTIMRGDRVGFIGPNGAGKTTLMNVLLGRLAPSSGSIKQGTNLEISYFDQHREQLDQDKSVRDNIAGGNDQVTVNGRTRHVMGYLKDFLFTPDRANSPVSVLSGGERNRLLLARLFTRPSNVLAMDEPTNDLDAETLELLEERLDEYSGTVLLVSHDRAFLNNIATSTIALEGDSRAAEYVGGYDDWLRQRPQPEARPAEQKKPAPEPETPKRPAQDKPKKLSYMDQREKDLLQKEMEELPERLDALEKEVEAAQSALADPELYKGPQQAVQQAQAELERREAALEEAYARWEEVETRLEELG